MSLVDMSLTGCVLSSLCPEGFACPFGTGGAANPPLTCALGHACPSGSPSPTANPCPHGTFSNSTSLTSLSDCTPCPAGFYCTGGQQDVSGSCAKGHYCPMGTNVSDAFPCASGTFMSHVRGDLSLIFISIYHEFFQSNATSQSDCTQCPLGKYCLEGATEAIACPLGSFSNTTGTQSRGRIVSPVNVLTSHDPQRANLSQVLVVHYRNLVSDVLQGSSAQTSLELSNLKRMQCITFCQKCIPYQLHRDL